MRASTIVILLVAAAATTARAGLFFHRDTGTPPPGKPRRFEHTLERAGSPHVISAHAQPTNTPEYVGYYVGGGSAHGGDARTWQEGTWGWDYEGMHFRRHVGLNWSHGRRYQGGTGSYRADGPHLPDVFIVPRRSRSEDH
ncbi:MAG: hypothetical protein P4L84_19110 [Isosphaeraceae bacterium]|nr:hypothetical protein [Isosphaeraceae bacterium]